MPPFLNSLTLVKDIRFWIVLFFLIHLCFITLPPLEPGSTWRQTDGLMIARNFYERNSNILYPTVDLAGEKTGIVGCEFPILNYLIYLISLIFGFQSWYGRLINLFVSSVGIYFFFKLIKDQFNKETAFNSAIFVLVSIWFTYNRTNIPDTFALSLCMISLYYGVQFLKDEKKISLFPFFLFGLLGCLSKISAACILTLLAIPFLLLPGKWKSKAFLSILSILILGSVCAWYFYWVPYLNNKFGMNGHFFMGMSFGEGFNLLMSNIPLTLKRFYDTPFKYTGFLVFLTGVYFAFRMKNWLLLTSFLIPFITYLYILIRVAIGLHVDAYYVIMYIPPMALVMGWGVSQLNSKLVGNIILLIVATEGIANQLHILQIRQPTKSLIELESIMDKTSSPNDLIVINGDSSGDPTPMYMAHRRGWVANTEEISNQAFLNDIQSKGCRYAVIVKVLYGNIDLPYPKLLESEYFKIYDLRKPITNLSHVSYKLHH